MKKSVMLKWVKALRSGKYKQGKGALKHAGRHCCLGVLCEVAKKDGIEVKFRNELGLLCSLPSDVQRYAEMESRLGYLSSELSDSLAELNDLRKYNFKQIANIIEKH